MGKKLIAWLRTFFEPWHHLGYVEIVFTSGEKVTGRCTIHLYAKGEGLTKRKVELGGSSNNWESHTYYQQMVVPWLKGGSLYGPVDKPSDWFKDYVLQKTGYKYVGDKWVKPAPPVTKDGNVVSMVKKNA